MSSDKANISTSRLSQERSLIIYLMVLTLGLHSCNLSDETLSPSQPNIILIMTDDQGYGDLGFTGNQHIKTPHLDRLGAESVSFTNFHVGTTCAPTRAGLLSGMHCNRTGTWHTVNGRSFLGTKFPTIATYLKEAGYHTGIFGKWHLGDNYPFRPQDRGFAEVVVHGGGGVGQTPDLWNNDYYDDTYFHNGQPEKYDGYCTDVWFEEATKFITSSKDQPFFCYISTNSPHSPHHVPQQYIDMYAGNESIPNPNFYGQITNVDDNYGKLSKYLEDQGLTDNTIVIFLTDNGTAAGASFNKDGQVTKGYNASMRGKKGSEYEGGHRVPLFIKFPKGYDIEPQSHDDLVSYTDLLPTLLDIAAPHASVKENFDGTSIYPLLKKGEQKTLSDRILISDTQRNDYPVKWKNASVMKNHWRLVNQEELYNLKHDPSQLDNVIMNYPAIANELSKGYDVWWSSLQEDISIENRIIIGSSQEQPSLLTCHDWHTDRDPPWHQRHIREGKLGNGTWWLEVEQSGTYKINLYRYPPEINKPYTENLPIGEEVEGGKPYKPGIGTSLVSAKIEIQDESFVTDKSQSDIFYSFEVTLDKGPTNFKATLIDDQQLERGAYYAEISLLDSK